MHENTIDQILEVLRPVIRNRSRAKKILQRHFLDMIAIIWATEDVHRAANERELALTKTEARSILRELHHHHNHQYGVKWRDVVELIQDSVVGRKVTKRELDRFVHKDIITIAKPKKRK